MVTVKQSSGEKPVIVVEARIESRFWTLDARASICKFPVVGSSRLASTRLPTPLATRPRSAGKLARLSTPDNGRQAGNGGQVRASSPLNNIHFDSKADRP
jgi:hypothetical protein